MVKDEQRCVIVCASPDLTSEFVIQKIQPDDYVICADAGADVLLLAGIVPNVIVGDFDSSQHYSYFQTTEKIYLSVHKEETDTMHCAEEAVKRGFKQILLIGATGGRLDHTLANLSVLLYLSQNGIYAEMQDQFNTAVLLQKGTNILEDVKGKTISVIPFACDSAVLTYSGLYYPLDKGLVKASYPYTISNYATEETVKIILHRGTALMIISESLPA